MFKAEVEGGQSPKVDPKKYVDEPEEEEEDEDEDLDDEDEDEDDDE